MNSTFLSQPLSIRNVTVKGNERTLEKTILCELKNSKKAKTVEEVIYQLNYALQKLKQRECFESIEIYCDTPSTPNDFSSNTLTTHQDNDLPMTDITITLHERRILNLKAETYIKSSGSEGGVETGLKLVNPSGRTENIQATISYGSESTTSTRFELFKPRIFQLPISLQLIAGQSMDIQNIHSSFSQQNRSFQLYLQDHNNKHRVEFINSMA